MVVQRRREIVRVDWDEIGPEFLRSWGRPRGKFQPEHVAILGPTGSGKSYFMTHMLNDRANMRGSHVVIVATKPADKTMKQLGWQITQKWPVNYDQTKVIYWPKAGSIRDSIEKQRLAILDLLDELWKPDANIIVAFDEISYVEEDLKLAQPIRRYWREARALGITVVATTQRPFRVNRTMWSEATWRVAFRPSDEDDAKRVAEVLGSKTEFFEPLMNDLNENEFMLVNRGSKTAYISKMNGGLTASSEESQSRK